MFIYYRANDFVGKNVARKFGFVPFFRAITLKQLGHEKLIFCFSGTFLKKRMREGELFFIVSDYFFPVFPQ